MCARLCVILRRFSYDVADRSSISSRAFYKVPPYLCVHTLRPLRVPDSLTDLMCPNSACWQRGALPISQSSHLQPPRAVFLWLDPSQNNVHCLRDVGEDRGGLLVFVCSSPAHTDSASCTTLQAAQHSALCSDNRPGSSLSAGRAKFFSAFYTLQITVRPLAFVC